MPPKPLAYNAVLVRRDDFTPELATFHVRYDDHAAANGEGGAPAFVPGQYVAIGMNNDARPELGSVRRSMSLASAPEQKDAYEFYIRYVKHPESDNPLTHLLWKMSVGDRMFMTRKPVGVFTVKDTVGDDDQRTAVFVAAGTGLAPFVSMVRSEVMRDPKVGPESLRAPARRVLSGRPRLPRRAGEIRGREPACTTSAPSAARRRRRTGRATPAGSRTTSCPTASTDLEQRLGMKPGGLRPERAAVLICGLQGTIGETIMRLTPRGFVPDNRRIRKALEIPDDKAPHVWWEQYDTTPVIDINDPALVARLKDELHSAMR